MDVRSGASIDSHSAIVHVRQRIFDTLHLANSLLAPVAAFVVIERTMRHGNNRHLTIVLLVLCAILLAFLLRRHISYRARVAVVLCGYLLIAMSSVMSNGLAGMGSLLFVATPMLAVILLGIRGGAGVLVLAAAMFAFGAVAVVHGWVTVNPDLAVAHLSARSWIDRGVQMLMLTVIIGAAFAALDLMLVRMIERTSRNERLLGQREALYRAVFNGVQDAILVHDASGRIVDANPRAAELFCRPHDELLSMTIHQLFTGTDEPHASIMAAIDAAREKGSETLEWMFRVPHRGNGGEFRGGPATDECLPEERSVIWVELTLHLTDVNGAKRMLVTARDVTNRKEIEQERTDFLLRERQAREHAEVANRAKDHFLAVLSHELRTPLTPVLLTLSGWRDDPTFPPDHAEDLAMVTEQIRLETSLINDLLDVTRVARGTLRLEPSLNDVHALLRETVQATRTPSGPPLVLELKARHATASVDPLRFRQAIWNLLTNAQKFTPPDGRVTVRTSSPPSQPDTIRIEVIDTGAGIPSDLLPRVFTPFEQGTEVVASRPGGLGLGLPIARAIVQAHGGKLTAHSEGLGQGATFTIDLPVAADDAAELPAAKQDQLLGELAPVSAAPAAGIDVGSRLVSDVAFPADVALDVLLVEDHEHTAATLARVLSGSGYHVRIAHNVAEAIRSLDTAPPDVLVSDIGLPDGSGIDIMSHVYRRQLPTKGIAITGYGMDEDIAQTKTAGFAVHLTKPITIDELLTAMKRLTASA